MSKAATLARAAARHGAEFARLGIVLTSAASLILAGQTLPL